MAVRASGSDMGPRQRIIGLGTVIEARRRPGGRIVAFRAGEAEGRRGMDGIGCASEIFMMAGVAVRRRAGVPLAVTFLATHIHMSAGQWEITQIMVEAGVIPSAGAMAHFAGGRKVAGHMIGIGRSFVILLMAGIA